MSCAGGTAYSALRKVQTTYADTVAVFGLGPVGLMAVMFGRAMGARVIGIDLIPERLELGSALGAEAVIDARHEDPVACIAELTGGVGATVGVEASGNSAVRTKTIYEATSGRAGTRIVYLALGDPAARMGLIFGARTVTRNHIFSIPQYHEMCRLIANKGLEPGSIITHRFSLDQATEAYELLESGRLGKAVFDLR
jgi:threonine dehydrogenase-like Zn-dependent dehydrogenase